MELQGSGTSGDPWQISTKDQMAFVLRDKLGTGFYRVMQDLYVLDAAPIQLTPLLTIVSQAAGYLPKVIDLNGFGVYVAMTWSTANGACAMCSTIHFKNGEIRFDATLAATGPTVYLLYQCFATDCAIRGKTSGAFASAGTTYLFYSETNHPALITREIRRLVITNIDNPNAAVTTFNRTYITTPVTISQAYIFGTTSNMYTGFTARAAVITLASLPAEFVNNGWWESVALLYPFQLESVALSVETLDAGVPVRRLVWAENDRQLLMLGMTGVDGLGSYSVLVRRHTGFTLYASEDLLVAPLRSGAVVAAGGWYAPPIPAAYVYQASASGTLGSLTGVTFDGNPVVVGGITFTPLIKRKAAVSDRLTVAAFGSAISRVLDNATGGGGPAIDGDPAYLDGVVEEVHPLLGTVRPLTGSEVVVFERRTGGYVSMGSAYSNAVGEFRVETDVYGGGDVFAFAADFPGIIWQPGIPLGLGDRIRPPENNGYVYEIVSAGVAGGAEPAWWADEGDGTEGAIGSATAKARPYYQPVGHGPLKMTLVTP